MLIIGVTGGIGSGKTAATDEFARLGICIIDADIAARTVVEAGQPALQEISQRFGKSILLESGELDRAALRKVVFTDPLQRSWLEQLTHPLIHQEITTGLKRATSPYAILASPLLLESKQFQLVNRVLVVDTPEELQISRTVKRDDNNPEQVKSIISAQLPRKIRQEHADDIILNDQGLDYLHQQVKTLHNRYLELSLQNES